MPRYIAAKQVTLCVRDVSGRNISFLGLTPITIKCANMCANVTAYYLKNFPVSAILGLDAIGRMDIWVRTSAQAGGRIKECSDTGG